MLTKREACWGTLGGVGGMYAVAAACWTLGKLTLVLCDLVSSASVIEFAHTLQNFITNF